MRIKWRFPALPQTGLRESELEEWKAHLHGWPSTHQHKLCSLSTFLGLKGMQECIENPGSSQMVEKLEQELGSP